MTPLATPRSRFIAEMHATLRLAAPIVGAQLAQIGMGITDTVLLGGLGRDALAAGGLGAMMFFVLVMILQGLMSAAAILIAHARGADRRATASASAHAYRPRSSRRFPPVAVSRAGCAKTRS